MATEILIAEAAKILQLSTNHVRYLDATGQLPCRRVGHVRIFDKAVVERLAARRYALATGQTFEGEDGDSR